VRVPPVIGEKWQIWAEDLRRYLGRVQSQLTAKEATSSATEDGVILWDRVNGYPVVSKGGLFRQIVLGDGYAIFNQDVDITAAAADTAYEVALDLITTQDITLTGSPLTDITFAEGGLYSLAFTAQIASTSASQVDFRFWPRINTNDVAVSTIVASLHNNGATNVVSRIAIFTIDAGDVLNVMWAVSNTNGRLKAHAATGYAPASPSVTLAIHRIQA
jgi:hypothetical protein